MKKLESLSAFQARTGGFIFDSLPHGGALQTNENLSRKVDGSGKMKPFAGNTVVFPLPEAVKRELGAKWAAGMVIGQCAIAWVMAWIVRMIGLILC